MSSSISSELAMRCLPAKIPRVMISRSRVSALNSWETLDLPYSLIRRLPGGDRMLDLMSCCGCWRRDATQQRTPCRRSIRLRPLQVCTALRAHTNGYEGGQRVRGRRHVRSNAQSHIGHLPAVESSPCHLYPANQVQRWKKLGFHKPDLCHKPDL